MCNCFASVPLLAPPTWPRTRNPVHTSLNSHPRSIVTYRSTKATALAEQGEQLLQGLRASDVTDRSAISAHYR
jgi:hypothetical protein